MKMYRRLVSLLISAAMLVSSVSSVLAMPIIPTAASFVSVSSTEGKSEEVKASTSLSVGGAVAKTTYRGDYVLAYNDGYNSSSSLSSGPLGSNSVIPSTSDAAVAETYQIDFATDNSGTDFNEIKALQKRAQKLKLTYTEGERRTFNILDLTTNNTIEIEFVCSKVGTYCYVWSPVSSAYRPLSEFSSSYVTSAANEFDTNYPVMASAFGDFVDCDGTGKVHLLYYDVIDGFSGSGGYVGGFFWSADMRSSVNGAAMLHLDTYPAISSTGMNGVNSTAVHEFQHLINYSRVGGMATWMNEAMSMAAQELIYPGSAVASRINTWNAASSYPNYHIGKSLFDWDNSLGTYGICCLFGQYLRVHTGGYGIFDTILDHMEDGMSLRFAIEDAITGTDLDGLDLSDINLAFRLATVALEASGLYGFNNEAAFSSIKKISVNGTAFIYQGGAVLINASGSYSVPTSADSGIVYVGIEDGKVIPDPVSVSLSLPTQLTIDVNSSVPLTVDMLPAGCQTAFTITSSDTDVVSIDASNNIKGLSYGSAKITVTTVNSLYQVINVNVGNEFEITSAGVLTKYNGSQSTVTIPENASSVAANAFQNNSYVKEIIFERPVDSIAGSAFIDCPVLEHVKFCASVGSLGEAAFNNCPSLALTEFMDTLSAPLLTGSPFSSVPSSCELVYYGMLSAWSDAGITAVTHKPFFFVNFNSHDGTLLSSQRLYLHESAVAPTAPERTGYTFREWSVDFSDITTDLTIVPLYDTIVFTVIVMDGLTYETIATLLVDYGTDASLPTPPVHEGYTFTSWSQSGVNVLSNLMIIAQYSLNSYVITYYVDDVMYDSQTYDYNATIVPLAEPTRVGSTFSGWSGLPTAMPAEDVRVDGSFTLNTYTVDYYLDGVLYESREYEFGATITPLTAPERIGYTFGGWSAIPTTMPAENIRIYGVYLVNTYNINYYIDDLFYLSEEYSYGATITSVADPERTGYAFSGWSDIPATMPAEDVRVDGSFTINTYTMTYYLDDVLYETIAYEYGAAVTALAAPQERTGYTFSGWSFIPEVMPANDVRIDGMFVANKYTITYYVDDVLYETVEYDYGATVTALAAPQERTGYTFSGWSFIPEVMPANDVRIDGSFTVNTYSMTYYVDNILYETLSYEYGAAVTALATPQERTGYTFSGWSFIPEVMPANDVRIDGSFVINTYTVTFIDGVTNEAIQTSTVEHGSDAVFPDAPVHDGYTFTGWSNDGRAITADTTITAQYEPISVLIGDINGDSRVNTGDAVMVLRYAANILVLTDAQLIAADYTGDGRVNTGDAVAILRFAAGLI